MSYSNSSHDEEESEHEMWTARSAKRNVGRTLPTRLRGGADSPSQASLSSAEVDEDDTEVHPKKRVMRKYMRWLKITILLIFWFVFTIILLVEHEHEHIRSNYICVPPGAPKIYELEEASSSGRFYMKLLGPFVLLAREDTQSRKVANAMGSLFVTVLKVLPNNSTEPVTDVWDIDLVDPKLFDVSRLVTRRRTFELKNVKKDQETKLRIEFKTDVQASLALELIYEASPVSAPVGVIVATVLVIAFYILLTLDIIHRALASVIFCTLAVSMLALLHLRPSLMTIIAWIDFETLLLLFGLTIIVAMFAETGIIDYLAVRAYEMANGHIWPLLNTLCLITVLGATIFDNVFMILLVAPITLRLCEVMELNPIPVLTCLMVSTNVGSAVLPNGEPPNVYITKSEYIHSTGMHQGLFVLHILPGTIIAAATAYIYMRIQYYNTNKFRYKDGAEVERLRRVIKVWSRTAKSISAYSKDEKIMRDTVMTKVRRLRTRLRRLGKMPMPTANYAETLKDLKAQYPIRNRALLVKCIVVMLFTIAMIVLNLVPNLHYLSMAWTALLGAMLLLIVADHEDFEGILGRIEWSTMLFLATVFVLTECMGQLGFFDYIANWTHNLIIKTNPHDRLSVAIVVVLWFSAIGSAFLTDSSVGNMMLRVALTTYEETGDELPLHPMLWAVVMGTSFGGIGTIVGTYANVICAGLAEKHGYNFPYLYYLKVGFPIMITCVCSAMIYLLMAHCIFSWN